MVSVCRKKKKEKKNQEVTWVSLLVMISFHRQTLNLSLMQDVENLIYFKKSFVTVRWTGTTELVAKPWALLVNSKIPVAFRVPGVHVTG